MNPDDVLILSKYKYLECCSNKKYRVIILNDIVINDCLFDIFMLSASRLATGGELTLRFCGDLSFASRIKNVAITFGFDLPSSSNPQASQITFSFLGREAKNEVQMARSTRYADSCIMLFESVFGHSISREFWYWKYPLSRDVKSVVALEGQTVISHYGLCDRAGVYNSKEYNFLQAADVMVSPSHRGRLSSSIFSELVQFGERPFYRDTSDIGLIYGFPHGKAYRLGKRLKHYQPVSSIYEVTFNIVQMSKSAEGFVEAFSYDPGLESEVRAACLDMMQTKDVLLLRRDYNYLLRRYFFHPEYNYRVFKSDCCFFVVRVLDDKLFLMDYFGCLSSYSSNLRLFISYLSNLFSGFTLQLWCLESILSSFESSASVVDTGAYFVYKEYKSNLPEFNTWWITKGDTDFL